jgi:hypothetical protein
MSLSTYSTNGIWRIRQVLFAQPVEDIASAHVEQTFVAGERVYASADAG